MARISTYDLDGTISNTDKVIGTDSSNTTTKNFKLQSLKEFIFSGISGPVTINSSGVSSVTFPDVTLGTDTSGSYVESLVAGDGIQLLNNSGEGATPTIKVNPLQTTITSILNTGLCVGRDSTDKICFTTDNQIRFTVNNALDLILAENALTPGSSDGTALGTTSLMWSDLFLASGSVVNFNNGNVTVTHGDGVLQIDTDSKLEFRDNAIFINSSADGQLDIDADDEIEINSAKIDIDATGNGSDAIVIEATAGGIDVLASGAAAGEDIDIIATGSSVNITSTENDASAIHLNASAGGINIDASSGDVDIDSSTVDMLTTSTMVLLSQSTASLKGNTGATFGDDTEQIVFNGSGNVDFDAVTLDIDASSTITLDGTGVSIDGTLDSNFTVTGSGKDLTLSVAGGGTQQLILNSAGTGSTNAIVINSSAGGLDIDAAAGASIDAVGITINSGSGELDLTTSGTMDVNSVAFDLDASGAITIDGTSTVSIDGAGATNLTTSSGNITIDSAAGSVLVDGHTGVEITSTSSGTVVIDGKTGVSIEEDGTAVISIDTNRDTVFSSTGGSTSDPDVEFDGYTRFDDQVEVSDTTNSTSVSTGALVVDGGVGVASNLNVGGTLEANGLTYPANVNDANINEVLTKTSNGTIGFSTPASVGVSANTDDSDRTVVFANGNVLHDDNDTVSSSSFKYNPNDKILTVNNIVPKTSDDGSLGTSALSYSDLFLANGGIIEFKAGTGNRSQITHIDGSSGNDGSLRISSSTKLEFNDEEVFIASLDDGHLDLVSNTELQIVSPIVNIDASTRVDISGALIVGGTLTLDSVGVSAIQTSGESFVDNNTSLMTSAAIDDRINSAQSMGSGFVLEDDSGDEVTITESKEVKFIGSGGLTINWTDTDNGTDGDPYDLTFTIGTLNQDTTGTADKVTVTDSSANTSFPLVFHNESNGLLDNANGFEYNPSKTKLCLGFDTNTTDVDVSRNLISAKSGNHFFELRDTSTNGGTLLLGQVSSSGNYNCIFSREKDNGATNAYEFRIIQSSGGSNVNSLIIGTDHAATFINSVTATAFTATNSVSASSFAAKSNTNSKGAVINLSTTDTAIIANDILGTIEFQAPDEANGNDAAIIAAEIRAVAEETFDNTSNDTKFEFITSRGTAITSSTAPVATISSIGQFVLNTPASGLLQTRSIKSVSTNTSGHYFEINSTQSGGTGGSLVIGVAGGANRIFSYDNTGSASSTRKFEIVTNGSDSANFIFDTDGDLEAGSYSTSSDKRLKSEIEPIKEGLEVIKQFSSYTYIKSGKKESGFIAQEVKEVIPHAVHENDEGYLSMSDRGVLAHMHKAILELDKRLQAIEDKIKN